MEFSKDWNIGTNGTGNQVYWLRVAVSKAKEKGFVLIIREKWCTENEIFRRRAMQYVRSN
jgi:hypothetical protein